MKKLNLNQNYAFFNKAQKITSILLIFVSVMFIANSCTKENELSKEDAIQLRTDMTPEQRVAAFTPVVNGTFNPAKTYTGQEAVLGVETVLNYEYGDFSKQFDETYSLKDTFTVAKEGGIITDRVVSDIYAEALQLMKCHYANILLANKVELLADLNLVSENSSHLQVGLNNVVGTASQVLPIGPKTFQPGDDWKADEGKCSNPSYPSSGAEEVAKYANWNLVGMFQQQAGVWYSDISTIGYMDDDYWHFENENDPNPGDNIIDYHLWKAYGSSYEIMCLEHNEMNYYLRNAEFEAKRYEPILHKTFLNIDMWYDFSPNTEDLLINALGLQIWGGIGTYGKKNIDYRYLKELGPCN